MEICDAGRKRMAEAVQYIRSMQLANAVVAQELLVRR